MGPTESEDLAERLRFLYRAYDCENELPGHESLVAKLDKAEPELRDVVKVELDRDYVYPISLEKAKKEAKAPLDQKLILLVVIAAASGVTYAEQKCVEKNQPCEGFPFFSRAAYGGLKAFPSVFKEIVFKGENPVEIMDYHNKEAKRYFEIAKINFKYVLDA